MSAIEDIVKEFDSKVEVKERRESNINNSGTPSSGSWTEKIVEKIRISELAREQGIDCCPNCEYPISFNDNRGWFICVNAKYNHSCNFKGNIVDFVEQIGGLK